MNSFDYREVLGQRLRDFRESRNISMYEVARRGGIRIEQVKAVESGVTNYTIDIFLGYILGSGLYMYFAEKINETDFPDFEELISKAKM